MCLHSLWDTRGIPDEGTAFKVFRRAEHVKGGYTFPLFNFNVEGTVPVGQWIKASDSFNFKRYPKLTLHGVDKTGFQYENGFHLFQEYTDPPTVVGEEEYVTVKVRYRGLIAHGPTATFESNGSEVAIVAREIFIEELPQ